MPNRKTSLLAFTVLLLAGAAAVWAAPSGRRPSPLSDSLFAVRRSPSLAARAAFRDFVAKQGGRGWKIRYNPRTALPAAITGGRTISYPGTPEQSAMAFFTDNKGLLNVDPSTLRLVLKKEFMGVTHLEYRQYKDGIPVEFSYARVHVLKDGRIAGYQGRYEPDLALNTTPAITAQAAVAAADAAAGRSLVLSGTELVIYPDEADGVLKLAWKVTGRGNGLWVYYVDASDGSVLFRYDQLQNFCNGVSYQTYGTSSGTVYAISPLPTYDMPDNLSEIWRQPAPASLPDQHVWVAGSTYPVVTNAYGDYCTQQQGKVFSSLQGPYFSVTNFLGASASFDNGGGRWLTKTTPVSTPHPYSDNTSYSYPVSINTSDWLPSYPGGAFAKVMPHFASFSAGSMDGYGSVNDEDTVQVKSGSTVYGSYLGSRSTPFFGAAVENPSYTVTLDADASGTSDGFTIDYSSYMVLTVSTGATSNATGSVVWSTAAATVYMDNSLGPLEGLSEINAFYHLNAVHRFFEGIDIDPSDPNTPPADISGQVPVMVHATGDPDALYSCYTSGVSNCSGMLNAFYDLQKKQILLGDGVKDNTGQFRSFALDGTIVRHEYTHLVVDHIYPIVNFGEFGAISEAMADFFSLSSFWDEGYDGTSYPNQITLGSFVGAGEGSARDISGSGKPTYFRRFSSSVPPACTTDGSGGTSTCWAGEVHDDSLFLSQTLYELANPNGTRYQGKFSAGTFAGKTKAEILAFAALFYFPDDFANFEDAMQDACTQFNTMWPGQCDSTVQDAIQAAFADHNIGSSAGVDSFETSPSSPLCPNNNGPECATDASTFTVISATIYPLGDVDYYSLPLAAGQFTAALTLPMSGDNGIYYAYSLFLFDADRNYVTEANPDIYGTGGNACDPTGQCYTLDNSVTLNYTVPYGGGRYYLVVSASPNQYYGNSEANSPLPYTLTLSRNVQGTATAGIYAALYDRDEISFSVPYSNFSALGAVSSSTLTGAETVFQYAQLRDHDYVPVDLARTDLSGSYLTLSEGPDQSVSNTDPLGRPQISGRVRLQPGFAARYPGVGTVYLEIFGRDHLGHVVSLGVSNAINLTADRTDLTAFNNIIKDGGHAIVQYNVLSPGDLSIKVYTQAGALVKTLLDGGVPAGRGSVDWDGTNSDGSEVVSGIYFVKGKGAGLDKVVKIAVIR